MNTDRRISAKEMQRWIMEKTAEHFQEAIAESKVHFHAVDPDGDGMACLTLTWWARGCQEEGGVCRGQRTCGAGGRAELRGWAEATTPVLVASALARSAAL